MCLIQTVFPSNMLIQSRTNKLVLNSIWRQEDKMTNRSDNLTDSCSQIINCLNSQSLKKERKQPSKNSSRYDHYLYLIFLYNKIFMLNSPNLLDSWTHGAITVRMSTMPAISAVRRPSSRTNSCWEAKGFFQFQPFVYFALKSQNVLGFHQLF